jgi:hypothetical protein
MIENLRSALREAWETLLERVFFLPPFPESIDSLALFSLLLVVGLLIGEWLHAHAGWPKVIGYVLAGTLFGPSLLGWISIEALAQARPIADAALGLLMLEVGRRLDLGWLRRNPELLRSTLADITSPSSSSFLRPPAGRAEPGLGGRHGGGHDGFGARRRVAHGRGIQSAGRGDRADHPAHGDRICGLLRRLHDRPRRRPCRAKRRLAQCRGPSAVGQHWRAADRRGISRLALGIAHCCPSVRWRRSSSWSPAPCWPSASPACWRCRSF